MQKKELGFIWYDYVERNAKRAGLDVKIERTEEIVNNQIRENSLRLAKRSEIGGIRSFENDFKGNRQWLGYIPEMVFIHLFSKGIEREKGLGLHQFWQNELLKKEVLSWNRQSRLLLYSRVIRLNDKERLINQGSFDLSLPHYSVDVSFSIGEDWALIEDVHKRSVFDPDYEDKLYGPGREGDYDDVAQSLGYDSYKVVSMNEYNERRAGSFGKYFVGMFENEPEKMLDTMLNLLKTFENKYINN